MMPGLLLSGTFSVAVVTCDTCSIFPRIFSSMASFAFYHLDLTTINYFLLLARLSLICWRARFGRRVVFQLPAIGHRLRFCTV